MANTNEDPNRFDGPTTGRSALPIGFHHGHVHLATPPRFHRLGCALGRTPTLADDPPEARAT